MDSDHRKVAGCRMGSEIGPRQGSTWVWPNLGACSSLVYTDLVSMRKEPAMVMEKVFGSKEDLPSSVRTVRVLLFVITGISAMMVVAGLLAYAPSSGEEWGRFTFDLILPTLFAFLLARGITNGGRIRFWLIVAFMVYLVLMAITYISEQPAQNLIQILLPGLTLYFLTRPESRGYFRNARA